MSRLTLHVRSFHPLANFGLTGLGYHGDNRGFSTSTARSVTSRIRMSKVFDLAAATVNDAQVISDTSSHPFGMVQTYESVDTLPTAPIDSGQIDTYRPDGDQGLQAMVAYTGQNFAMPLVEDRYDLPLIGEVAPKDLYDGVVPGLDVTSSLHIEIDRDEERLSFTYRMVGDGFPNAEAFLLDGSSQPLMLATHRRIGSALHQLRGNRRIAMCSTSGEVDFPGDRFGSGMDVHWCLDYATVAGAQIDVMQETGKSPTTVEAWNEMHTKRDARGGFVRLTQDRAPLPTYAPGRAGSSMP